MMIERPSNIVDKRTISDQKIQKRDFDGGEVNRVNKKQEEDQEELIK